MVNSRQSDFLKQIPTPCHLIQILLNITGVEASFVFTVVKGVIYVSARSYDSMNVQLVMERLGGGGHSTMAGTQLKDMTVEEAEAKVKSVVKSMKMEGEI